MRTFKLILVASVAGLTAFSAAQAADAVDQIPEAPAAMESAAPVGNWSGAYVGAAGTYGLGRFRNGDDYKTTGFGGQLYGGYNMQNGQLVYGGEADIGYDGKDGNAGAGYHGEQGVNGSVRARVGYDMNPFLLYGTGGLAVTNNEISNARGKDDRTHAGYTVGAGVEAMVTNNVTARVEYRYSDYQDRDYNVGGTTVSRGFDDHSVKVGVGMKF
ncbi:outer membrane protein [Rhizobium sp. RU36D]|uniref:outer membrane protein n=1 Tax=Rhizobium sp. RU36D TaxID=1907415 RepID=UPI0009D7E961|nr:outer membrane protein [Rhizobium sp. RU36D]SMD06626.1 outer membrane immunogenic protein [Rhizobium sp. RU36D]